MPGTTDVEQLGLIFQNLGTPTEQQWPDMKVRLLLSEKLVCAVAPGMGAQAMHC